MNYLLDTHTVLWFLSNTDKLSKLAYNTICEPSGLNYISIASAWEVAVKVSCDKLQLEGGVSGYLRAADANSFKLMPIKEAYLKHIETLPFYHRDPFDRMLIATAISEDLCLITADKNIHQYDVPWLW